MATTQEYTAPSNKLYVGNVEYSTTKPELEELFKDYPIESIEIPTRAIKFKNGKRGKPKSKGYVFITFKPEVKDLNSIITKFTDYEFKDRKIYLSHPAPKPEPVEGETPKEEKTTTPKVKQTARKSSSSPATTKSKPVAGSKKEKIPFDKGTKSTDTVYLKNLDFQTTAKELREFFTEEGEEVRWVSVPFKRLPKIVLEKFASQGKTIEKRNKGYAFIKFNLKEGESIEDKITKYEGKTFKERELHVSVAVDVRNVEQDEADNEGVIEAAAETPTA